MAVDIWVPSPGMSPIEFLGHLEFRDIVIPIPTKNEWGVDVLDRMVQGPASRIATFLNSLKQGTIYKDAAGDSYFLQSWQPIEHKCFPGAQLTYKGFKNDGLPDPLPSTTRDEIVSTLTASGLHVTLGGDEDTDSRVIVGGTREIKYVSPTTTWRYINRGEPKLPKFQNVKGNVRGIGIVNRGSVIYAQFEDGGSERFVGSAPAALATALFAIPYIEVTGPAFFPIVGTPFYECEEVCQLRYPDS